MNILSIFKKADTLYFPGCMTCIKYEENFEFYKKIFSKLGINVIGSQGILCCGLPALELGYEQEARKLARRNFEIFKENGVRKIMTNCPACYKMFSQDYPELLPDWDIEVENMWKLILDKLESKPRLIKYRAMESVGFHDSCYLGRYCGIYEEPRRILELIGYNVVEMYDSRENSVCAGSCGGLVMVNSELADKIAYQRLLQAKRAKVEKMIVASLNNYDLLKKSSESVEILELSEVLAKAFGIKVKEPEVSEEEPLAEEPSEQEQIIIDIAADEKIKEELKNEGETEEDLL